MKFRKKPVVIESIQWTGKNFDEVSNFTKNFHGHKKAYEDAEEGSIRTGCYYIDTLEGSMKAALGDWIIKGVNGEFYPCKPGIFAKTYEAVTDESLSETSVSGGEVEVENTELDRLAKEYAQKIWSTKRFDLREQVSYWDFIAGYNCAQQQIK